MLSSNAEYLAAIELQCTSAVGDGMHVEITGQPSRPHEPLVTFRADEQLGMLVVLHGDTDLALPLSELKRAIAFPEAEVHPESFYD